MGYYFVEGKLVKPSTGRVFVFMFTNFNKTPIRVFYSTNPHMFLSRNMLIKQWNKQHNHPAHIVVLGTVLEKNSHKAVTSLNELLKLNHVEMLSTTHKNVKQTIAELNDKKLLFQRIDKTRLRGILNKWAVENNVKNPYGMLTNNNVNSKTKVSNVAGKLTKKQLTEHVHSIADGLTTIQLNVLLKIVDSFNERTQTSTVVFMPTGAFTTISGKTSHEMMRKTLNQLKYVFTLTHKYAPYTNNVFKPTKTIYRKYFPTWNVE